MDPHLYDSLNTRLTALENQARNLRSDLDAFAPRAPRAAETVPPARVEAPAVSFVPATPAPASPPRAKSSLEMLVAGRGLQIAGLFLVLLGTAFFLELAFTHGWIGPIERILLGLVAGSALIAVGARGLGGAYRFLNEGLIGLGAGILYLSLWASIAVFPDLHVSRTAAFAAMIAVTAVVGALSMVHRSERLALMGVIGGFLTPVLLAGGPADRVVLATYLLLLTAGTLAVTVRCEFRIAEFLAFFGAFAYAGAFQPDGDWTRIHAYTVASIFFVIFAAALTIGAQRSPNTATTRGALLALVLGAYAWALETIFSSQQRTLGITLLIAAAALLIVAQLRTLPRAMRLAYGYLGLATVTLALPALVENTSLIDVFSIEAAVLVVIGTYNRDRWLVIAGVAMFVLTGLTLMGKAAIDEPSATVFNPLSLAFIVWLGSLFAARNRFANADLDLGDRRAWTVAGSIAFNAVALTGLSRVVLDLLGGPHWSETIPSHAQFALSLLWTLYATVLFGFGLRRGTAYLRWQGLALFVLTIFKVFIVDLASLDAVYRVGSFIGLGTVLVIVSAWYTRSMVRRGTPGDA